MQRRLKAAFYRGGTSKAVVFDGRDLPSDKELRDRIFLHVLGSPDPYGRQLDGMGGGLSSLSKVVIVEPSTRQGIDVDYTFVQIAVGEPIADYGSACGNMSSCVGPFAVDEGMVTVGQGDTEALVRIFNTNTSQVYHARFPVLEGKAVEAGDLEIPGVSVAGAKIEIAFLEPGGSVTGNLLPTGNPVDVLTVEGVGEVEASMVDAANPVVFVKAESMGKTATELPQDLDGDKPLMEKMEAVRQAAAVAMGMVDRPSDTRQSNPKIAIVSSPAPFTSLDGENYGSEAHDIAVRIVSMGNFHRAITLTGGMCVAVAARIDGSLINRIVRSSDNTLRIGNPSGILPVSAHVEQGVGGPHAVSAGTFRTQRRIMEGAVLYPPSLEFFN